MSDTPQEPRDARVFDLGPGFWGNVGLAVFLISAFGAVIVVIWLILRGGTTDMDYRVFRGLEIVLSVAALGLIATLMGRTANVLALIVGFLVISALVIPTRDLVRITLIATGSEKTLDHYYGSSGVAANISGRVSDTADNVVEVVEDVLEFNQVILPSNEMDLMKFSIQQVLQIERIATLRERVKARGVFELLSAVGGDETEAFLYRHSQNDRLLQDIQFLRYEGLISIAYDEVSTAEITTLGQSVLDYEDSANEESALLTDQSLETQFSGFAGCNEVNPVDVLRLETIDPGALPFELPLQPADTWPLFVKLNILPGEVGRYQIDVITNDPSNFDPVVSVLSYEQTESSRFDICRTMYSNDDINIQTSDALDSRILEQLPAGNYLIAVDSFAGGRPDGLLRVTRP